MRGINHPAIVQLLDVCLELNQLGYVSPLGTPLDTYWRKVRTILNPTELYDRAGAFMASIADGMAAVHGLGIIHRDLKAGNVIVIENAAGPQPVVIDFGLAFRPGDERLSIIDGRRVRNVDAAPAEAYYRHIDPTPAWDCIGLGWLYGYLLGADKPDHQRFHWKYHPLVPEARSDRVRSLMATCSDVEYAPRNAQGFHQLMDALGLLAPPQRAVPFIVDADGARRASQEGRAARQRLAVEQADLQEVCARLFNDQLNRIRAQLNEAVAAALQSLPIALNQGQTSPVIAARHFSEHFRAAFGGDQPGHTCIFSAVCGTPPYRGFHVCVFLAYEPDPREGLLPFHLNLVCFHGNRRFPNKQKSYHFNREGAFVDADQALHVAVSVEMIVGLAMRWVVDAGHWRTAE